MEPIAWFKRQPLPLKLGLVALALILAGRLMAARRPMATLQGRWSSPDSYGWKTPGETH